MELVSQGAEAKVYSNGSTILKERVSKGYRIPVLDQALRAFRTRREAKILSRLSDSVNVPKLYCYSDGKRLHGKPPKDFTDLPDIFLMMELVEGQKIKDSLEKSNYGSLMKTIGKDVATMHSKGIIHGDLTTSNIIMRNVGITILDFGLSYFSDKVEDRAVDLHLFRQSLESGHPLLWESAWEVFIGSYSKYYEDSESVLMRLEKVENRGRYKNKA